MVSSPAPAALSTGPPTPACLPWRHLGALLLVFLLSAQGRIGNEDSTTMLALSRSLVEGRVTIRPTGISAPGQADAQVSQYGLLTSVLWIPFLLIGRGLSHLPVPLTTEQCEEFVVSFCPPLLMTGLLTLLAASWRSRGASEGTVRAGIWMIGLGTLFWPHAKLPGSDVVMAILILLAWLTWERANSPRGLLLAGGWLGLALLARKQAQTIIPVLLLLWAVRTPASQPGPFRWPTAGRTLAWLSLGILPSVLASLAYNFARFGHPLLERYPGADRPRFPGLLTWLGRILGQVLSQQAGLLWYATPVLLALALAARRLRTAQSSLFLALILLLVTQTGFLALLYFWDGGTYGPRYLLFWVALAALGWAYLPDPLPTKSLAAALAIGLVINVPGVLTDPLPVISHGTVPPIAHTLAARFHESAIVLGLTPRPRSHDGHLRLTHAAFQVPDLWWCQAWRQLRSRPTPASPSPSPLPPAMKPTATDPFPRSIDPALQADLARIDQDLRQRLGLTEADSAVGLFDLLTDRCALLHPDRIEYGASVPKLGILLAWFALHPGDAEHLDPEVRRRLGAMIKVSSNEEAARFSQELGLGRIQEVLRTQGFYDPAQGGGIWVGKHYGVDGERTVDPVGGHSHGATVRQVLRFLVQMERDQLLTPAACRMMRACFDAPELAHVEDKFVQGLAGRPLTLRRKSGTWEDWRHDAVVVLGPGRHYALVALTHHPRGDDYLSALATAVDDRLAPGSGKSRAGPERSHP